MWNKAGRAPEDVQELGPEAWQPQGLKVLGTPIGTPEFVSQKMNDRIEDERRVCESARRRHVTDSGNSPVTDTRHGGGKGICQGVGNLTDEDGRVGSQVCNQMGRVSVLGIVGRRPPHDS